MQILNGILKVEAINANHMLWTTRLIRNRIANSVAAQNVNNFTNKWMTKHWSRLRFACFCYLHAAIRHTYRRPSLASIILISISTIGAHSHTETAHTRCSGAERANYHMVWGLSFKCYCHTIFPTILHVNVWTRSRGHSHNGTSYEHAAPYRHTC